MIDMIVHLSDAKNSTRKLLEMIKGFSKVLGYKIIQEKLVAFLYNSSKQRKKEYKETFPITIASKIIKYLGTNLIEDTKDLYNKNYKSLKKEIENDIRRWKDLPC